MDAFSNWLQAELEEKGLSQHEFARLAGVSQGAIGNVIRGDRQPGPQLCMAIARALHIPPEQVFRRAGLLPPTDPATEETEELLYLLSNLPQDARRELLEFARFKAQQTGPPPPRASTAPPRKRSRRARLSALKE